MQIGSLLGMPFLERVRTFFVVHGDRIAMGWFLFGIIGSVLFGIGYLFFGPTHIFSGNPPAMCWSGRYQWEC